MSQLLGKWKLCFVIIGQGCHSSHILRFSVVIELVIESGYRKPGVSRIWWMASTIHKLMHLSYGGSSPLYRWHFLYFDLVLSSPLQQYGFIQLARGGSPPPSLRHFWDLDLILSPSSVCMWWVPPPSVWSFWDFDLVLSSNNMILSSLHVVGPSSLWHFLSRIPRVVSHYGDTFFVALKWRLFVSHY